MKRTKYLIGGLLIVSLLAGCGSSPSGRSTSGRAAESDTTAAVEAKRPVVRKAGLYQSDGSFIPWDDLGIDIEYDFPFEKYQDEAEDHGLHKMFGDHDYNGRLVLPVYPTYIGEYAFFWCDTLTGIDLSDTQIASIGRNAFEGCISLASIDFSNTQITRLGESAFYNCTSLKRIDLSDTQISEINASAFYNCTSLTRIDLPNTLTDIGQTAFGCCTALTNINYAGTMEEWNAIEKYTAGDTELCWNYESAIETITCTDGMITL